MKDAEKALQKARDAFIKAQGGIGAFLEAAVQLHEESVATFTTAEREQYQQLRSDGRLPLDAVMLVICGRQ